MPEVADSCGLSYTGLEQHLLFYHKDLVKRRIRIRKKALRRQRKGEITGRGTVHAPSPELVEKYAEAVHLYATTPMSAARIAGKTGVSKKGFYEHLQRWHLDLVCRRKNIPYEEGRLVDWSKVRKYNPATKAKYAEAIRRLKESGLPTAQVAAEFGLQPEAFRSYLKEHEPELYARKGMVRTGYGRRGVPPQHGEIQRGHAPVRHDNRKREVVGQAVRVQRLLVRAVHQKEFPRTGRKAQRNRPEKRKTK